MITQDGLKSLLIYLNFTGNGDIYKKEYSSGGSIEVDFKTEKINYKPLDIDFRNGDFPTKDKPSNGFVIHRDTTINFTSNENFVCLFCVHLLLEKGYEPRHIVLEPAFKVGHVTKPSYGDILVFDKEYNPLVLIENKTFGVEFSKEWNNMQKNGGQLFSYLGPLVNTLGFCENIALFEADFDKKPIFKNYIITLKDNEKRIAELENPKTFLNAQGKYFDVWEQTYAKSFETKGLFENDIEPYTIGKQKYTVKDLKELSHAEIRPIYHEFATILRNNAITDFEHSFYILIDLFLCKITDEKNNPDDLQFYYKGITRDTPKEYCSRLLNLYQLGKKQLFDVDVVNKDIADIKQIFNDTNRSVENGLFAGIKELFEEIKFYNIKKFNFIDVENKEEFEINFSILIKIAALIQDINLSNSETNHFFGDLFEGLLSKNVHQTEGQFFTPLPIVNFIIKSLPEFQNTEKLKVLDYACGAGHFLTEFVKAYPNSSVYGIEKSQPLSQVAKIATIINGSKNSHIAFRDALSVLNTQEVRFQGFDKESFDVIIANPPYSVKGFLNTMTENDRNQFELTKSVDEKSYDSNKSIECFFIERSKHFLKKNGFMAIILPSSILSNGNLYTKVREILFGHFNILAIVSLGSRTFGSTGTNTIILFAQKIAKNSEGLLHTFIEKKDYTQYTTHKAIDSYIEKQGYNKDDYFSFMQDSILTDSLAGNEIFIEYKEKFKPVPIKKAKQAEWFKNSAIYNKEYKENSKEYKQLLSVYLNSEEYKKCAEDENKKQFIVFARNIECDKLNTFIQIESNNVVILQSPSEKDSKKDKSRIVNFLGYDWSNRKGDEGIRYITKKTVSPDEELTKGSEEKDDKDTEIVNAINSIKFIETPLYNPDNSWDNSKFSFALRKHIASQCIHSVSTELVQNENLDKDFSNEMADLLSYSKLSDLIDFSRAVFDKSIKTSVTKKIKIESKYELVKLGDVAEIRIGGTPSRDKPEYFNGLNSWVSISEMNGQVITDTKETITDLGVKNSNVKLIPKGTTLLSFKLSIGKTAVAGKDLYTNEAIAALIPFDLKKITNEFLFQYFTGNKLNSDVIGNKAFGKSMNSKYLKEELKLPLPPKEVQDLIVAECEEVDTRYKAATDKIKDCKEKIAQIMQNVKGEKKKLGKIAPYGVGRIAYSKIKPDSFISTDNILQNCEGVKVYEGIPNVNSIVEYKKGDILISNIRPYLRKCWLADKDGGCSPDVLVFRNSDTEKYNSNYLYFALSQNSFFDFMMQGTKGMKMPRGDKKNIPNYEILTPSLPEQERIVKEITAIEEEIALCKKQMQDTPLKKQAILEKYLK